MESHFSRVRLCAIPGTAAPRPLCPRDSPGENTGGLPCPPPGDLPDPGTDPLSPTGAGGFLTTSAAWETEGTWGADYLFKLVFSFPLE